MNVRQTEKDWNKSPFVLRVLGMGKSYFVKTPWWLKKIYPKRLWDVDTKEKIIYFTFDDGPHPIATPFVLDELKKYNAKATFFCIGKNVVDYPAIYKRILDEGHRAGNHTQNHLNGWNTSNNVYLGDVSEASKHISSNLFRPPYGRIRTRQAILIKEAMKDKTAKIVMWDVLSGDFDQLINNDICLRNVTDNTRAGSIVVFHDSGKGFPLLRYTLSEALRFFTEKGYVFDSL